MTNKLLLSPPDESFNHQFALPHQVVASSDPNWRERYWISIFDTVAKDTVLSFGFGKYPNRDVMDGWASLSRQGTQTNIRLSRQLLPYNDRIEVGSMRAEIVEPFAKLNFTLAQSAAPLAFDLTWRSTVCPALEGSHFEVSRGRVTHEIARYVQTGALSGWISLGDERIDVTPERWWGVRDHSWGIRPMAGQPGDPPIASPEWNFLAFCPIRFPSFSLHLYLFEKQPGQPTHLSAAVMRSPDVPPRDDEIKAVTHDLSWARGAPIQTLSAGTITIEFYSGENLEIEVTACAGRAFLAGGGYGWFQGRWFGASHMEHDTYDLAQSDRLRGYNAHASDHLIEARCNGETGFGIIEYLIRRAYSKYEEARGRSG